VVKAGSLGTAPPRRPSAAASASAGMGA
jgi:hypothetical protein